MALVAAAACGKRESAATGSATETIAPAPPQPATTGTDALTQTVDVEDSRSEAEGGALTEPTTAQTSTASATTSTTSTAATKTSASKKTAPSKKH